MNNLDKEIQLIDSYCDLILEEANKIAASSSAVADEYIKNIEETLDKTKAFAKLKHSLVYTYQVALGNAITEYESIIRELKKESEKNLK